MVHGNGTLGELEKVLGKGVPKAPRVPGDPIRADVSGFTIFALPSFANPEWNKWRRWADQYMTKVVEAAADELSG